LEKAINAAKKAGDFNPMNKVMVDTLWSDVNKVRNTLWHGGMPVSGLKDFYNKFTTHHKGDSGIDLYNFTNIDGKFLQVSTIDYEIKCEMINMETNEFSSYYLVPRSSISNTSFQLANSLGIIDAGYRGNIMAKIRCFNMDGSVLPSGSFFQIIAPDLKPIKVNVVENLSQTSRNDGGFGSTNQ
jgi:dUTP pyrophosphatase